MTEEDSAHIANTARDMRELLVLAREIVKYMKEAEKEIPEKMRRFMMYFHDVHDIFWLYQQTGRHPPKHVERELERCDDRYRHLLEDLYKGGETDAHFEHIRQEMAKRDGNRHDWSKQIKDFSHETR